MEPALLRAGQQRRAGVCRRSVKRDLLVLTSLCSLLEVVLPHLAVHVMT